MWQPKERSEVSEAKQRSSMNAEEVARIAYQLYEQRGRQDGYDVEDWLQAEAIVRRRARRS